MTSKFMYRIFKSLILILIVSNIASCSALTSSPPVKMATNTAVPLTTFTSISESLLTPILLPTISPPIEVISIQNISQLKQLDSREVAGVPEEFVHRSLDFTSDGRIVVGDYDTTVFIWDTFTGQQIDTLDHSIYLWNVAISPNGATVASGGESGIIKVWDLKTAKELYKFNHPGTIWSLAFSSDGTILASGTLDQSIKLWNLIDGKELDNLNDVNVESLSFSPDGKSLAIGTDYKIILWDVISKKTIKTLVFDLRGGEGLTGIKNVLFSPDGTMIAAADADNIAMVWDVSSGKRLSTIVGQGTIIRMNEGALAFSSDSKILAIGNDNGDIIFWDVLTNKELRRIGSKTCIPLDLIFWLDGNVFEIACWNGSIQLWGLP